MNLLDELLQEITPREQARTRNRMMLAARLADALTAKGWTQRQLAEKLGKNSSEISKWLSGTHNFTTDTLSDLEDVLGVKLLYVKEEQPRAVMQVLAQYGTGFVPAGRSHHPTAKPVPFISFQKTVGQS